MWKIVLFVVPHTQSSEKGLFSQDFLQQREQKTVNNDIGLTIDQSDLGATPIDIQDTVSAYAAPPDQFFSTSVDPHEEQEAVQEAGRDLEDSPLQQERHRPHHDGSSIHASDPMMYWTWPSDDMLVLQNANMFDEYGGTNLDWWDQGML